MKIVLLIGLALNIFAQEAYTVHKEIHNLYFKNDGKVEATYHAKISSQTSGVVTYVAYDVGDTFQKGAVLLKISSIRQFANLEEARLDLENTILDANEKEIKYKRLQALDAKNLAKDEDMTAARTAFNVSKKTVVLKQKKLSRIQELYSYTEIVAPFNGVIKKRFVHCAEKVSLGSELFEIYNEDYLRVLVSVPESLIEKIKENKEVLLTTKREDFKLDFKYVTVFPSSLNYSYTLRIKVPKRLVQNFHDGNFVGVRFKIGKKDSIYIQKAYVHQEYETPVVYMKHGKKLFRQFVRLGESFRNNVEVTSGINDGDIIVKNEK